MYICLSISRILQRIAKPGSYKERGSSLLPKYAEVFCPFAVPSLQQNMFIRVRQSFGDVVIENSFKMSSGKLEKTTNIFSHL